MQDLALSLLVLCAITLVFGAFAAWRRNLRKQAVLMLILAAVMAANVAIWAVPARDGAAPIGRELK